MICTNQAPKDDFPMLAKKPVNSPKSWQVGINLGIYLRYPKLVRRFHSKMGYWPNVSFPSSLQEKFLWRKVFDHNPFFTMVSDKLLSKKYAASICPDLKSPKVLWSGTDLKDAPQTLLESQGILKSNHGWEQLVFLPTNDLSPSALKQRTEQWMSEPYGVEKGEWAYADINRRLFIEELISTKSGGPITDYKVHVLGGSALFVSSPGPNKTFTRFRRDGTTYAPNDAEEKQNLEVPFPKPGEAFYKAISFAEQLGKNHDYIRCDFLAVDEDVWCGELTIYTSSGYPVIHDTELLHYWNNNWDLRKSWFLQYPHSGWRRRYAAALDSFINRIRSGDGRTNNPN